MCSAGAFVNDDELMLAAVERADAGIILSPDAEVLEFAVKPSYLGPRSRANGTNVLIKRVEP
jgi:hypothetical protein